MIKVVIASFPNQICYNCSKFAITFQTVIASFPNQICYNKLCAGKAET